jgi:hypothetical protein
MKKQFVLDFVVIPKVKHTPCYTMSRTIYFLHYHELADITLLYNHTVNFLTSV